MDLILSRREHYRKVFDGFDPVRVARYNQRKVQQLLNDPGIIRNRRKIESAVDNARAMLAVQAEYGTFDAYIWQFIGGRPRINRWKRLADLPAATPESDAMSKGLKKRGFRFVGSTICYAFMQAVGMVNDHLITCPRHSELAGSREHL